jgi:endonuclease YncB( thermonuclease family)
MTVKQNRMKGVVAKLIHYMDTYDKQYGYVYYSDATFINDVLYGIGIALNEQEYQYAQGFIKFKAFLKEFLNEHEGAVN